MIGVRQAGSGNDRMMRVASWPPIPGMKMSMKIRSYGVSCTAWTAASPVPTTSTMWPSRRSRVAVTSWFARISSASRTRVRGTRGRSARAASGAVSSGVAKSGIGIGLLEARTRFGGTDRSEDLRLKRAVTGFTEWQRRCGKASQNALPDRPSSAFQGSQPISPPIRVMR